MDGRLAGDSLELSALKGSGWQYDGNRSVALPPPSASGSQGDLRIVFRHPFSASLQRMSVVVEQQHQTESGDGDGSGAPPRHVALVKGSPEAMQVRGEKGRRGCVFEWGTGPRFDP